MSSYRNITKGRWTLQIAWPDIYHDIYSDGRKLGFHFMSSFVFYKNAKDIAVGFALLGFGLSIFFERKPNV